MQRFTMTRRRLLGAGTALGLVTLAGCGGGSDDEDGEQARVRVLNLSADVDSIDFVADDDTWFAAVPRDSVTDDRRVDPETYTVEVRAAGQTAALLSASASFESDARVAAVVWGRETSTRAAYLSEAEDNDDIDDGNSRTRVFNATIDAGALDVYLTAAGADVAESTAQHASIDSADLSGFRDIDAGTWRLRITGAGDPDDLRLDVPELVLPEQKHCTLIVAPSGGAVLVDAVLLPQRGEPTVFAGTKARLRVAAGADAAGLVSVTLAGATVVGGLRSPSVGAYAAVDAGTAELVVRVDGVVASTQTVTLDAGVDRTVLVWGAAGSRQVALLADDNRLPTSDARLKLRLVNGAASAATATLAVDYLAVATDVAAGTASGYGSLAATDSAQVDVTSSSGASALYSENEVALKGRGVYSFFVLGGNDAPTGLIRKER